MDLNYYPRGRMTMDVPMHVLNSYNGNLKLSTGQSSLVIHFKTWI